MLIANPGPTGSLRSRQKAVPPNHRAAGLESGAVQKTGRTGMGLEVTEAVIKTVHVQGSGRPGFEQWFKGKGKGVGV